MRVDSAGHGIQMRCARNAATIALMLVAGPVSAKDAERKKFIALRLGTGSIQIKNEQAVSGISEEEDLYGVGVYAGYNFDSGLVAEAGIAKEFSDDFFDSYDVSQITLLLGYHFPFAENFTFTPKAGVSRWDLSTFGSRLVDLGLLVEERSFNGTDPIWSLEGEYSWTDLVQLNLSYTEGSYGFGDFDSFRFGMEFSF